MREVNVRESEKAYTEIATQVKFGEDGECIEYWEGNETFGIIEDAQNSICVYIRDIPFLVKALKKLEELSENSVGVEGYSDEL